MTRRLNARIEEALAAKLRALEKATGQSTSDVVREAIERYYRTTVAEGGTAESALRATGFVGMVDGPSDLASDYKRAISAALAKKT